MKNTSTQKEEIMKIAGKYLPVFRECYERALFSLNGTMDTSAQTFYARSKATLLHNFVNNELKNELGTDSNVKIFTDYESVLLCIDGKLTFRFKKLNDVGMPCNIKTSRNDGFLDQQPFLFGEEEMPTISHLDVGYTVNATWTEFQSMMLLYIVNENIIWSYAIEEKSAMIQKFITDTTEPVIPTIKIKENKKKAN